MKLITLIFCFIFTTHALSQSTVEKTTIYLIRHAEKNDSSKDPELSQKGKKRAENWTNYFEEISIDNFYSSATKRTYTTCLIIASSKQKEVQLYDHRNLSIKEILLEKKGKTILIVGHSNTIPMLINTFLGEEVYPLISENEYGSLFTLTIQGDSNKYQLTYLNN